MVAVALGQLRDPMNIMLVAVTLVSVLIGEVSTGLIGGLYEHGGFLSLV